MNKQPIYFDYMATTPMDPGVVKVINQYLGVNDVFGNPASQTHKYGEMAAIAVENARTQIANTINAMPEEIIFTSGATESNNLALFGASRFYSRKGKHIITMTTEHKAVIDPMLQLEKEGFEITWLKPDKFGLLPLKNLESALREDTILVSIMHVNNEIGVIQDIEKIGSLLENKGIIFHVDAAQSAGKLPIDVRAFKTHLMSFSGHKNYGPKGIGALFISHKPRIRIKPIIFGGGHEQGIRAGTLPTHQIAAMGEAFMIGHRNLETEQKEILRLRKMLWNGIKDIPGIRLNGDENQRVAGNLNFSIDKIEGTDLIPALSEIAVSTTSACSSALFQPSYVLKAIGLSEDLANSSIRLSLGRFTSENDVKKAIEIINQQIRMLLEKTSLN